MYGIRRRRSSSSNGRDCAFVRKRTATSPGARARPRSRGRPPPPRRAPRRSASRRPVPRLVGLQPLSSRRRFSATRPGRLQDRRRRTVVRLEGDVRALGKSRLEAQDVLDLGPAPAVDRLVLVADDEEDSALSAGSLRARLRGVRVLVFVDEEVPDAPALRRRGPRSRPQKPRREDDQVVEVERARLGELLLVEAVDLATRSPAKSSVAPRIARRHKGVLGVEMRARTARASICSEIASSLIASLTRAS